MSTLLQPPTAPPTISAAPEPSSNSNRAHVELAPNGKPRRTIKLGAIEDSQLRAVTNSPASLKASSVKRQASRVRKKADPLPQEEAERSATQNRKWHQPPTEPPAAPASNGILMCLNQSIKHVYVTAASNGATDNINGSGASNGASSGASLLALG
ncbi:hypothetical protein ACHAP8_011855 [Fusarium lateritium]